MLLENRQEKAQLGLLSIFLWMVLCLFILFKNVICVDVLFASMSVYLCVLSALRGQKWVSDALELQLQMVVRCHVGSGN